MMGFLRSRAGLSAASEKEAAVPAEIYVVSRSSNHRFALMEGNMLEVRYGLDLLGQVRSLAVEHAEATGENAYVYHVQIDLKGTAKSVTEVVYEPSL